MKTKNNVQKTILRSIAVVLSFVLLSFTVSAQDFWKNFLTNSSFNEIATAMVEVPANSGDKNSKSDAENFGYIILDPAIETSLELEDWMLNENNFMETFFHPETEYKLNLEEWMLDENNFLTKEEAPLTLENWMVSDEVWRI